MTEKLSNELLKFLEHKLISNQEFGKLQLKDRDPIRNKLRKCKTFLEVYDLFDEANKYIHLNYFYPESLIQEFEENQQKEFFKDLVGEESKKQTISSRISGKLQDNSSYWITYFQKEGKYIPAVITRNKKERLIQIRQEIEGSFYFEYQEKKYVLKDKLFFRDTFNINIPSRRIFKLLEKNIKKSELYDRLKTLVKNYYDHSEEKEYDLTIPFIVVSYIGFWLGRTYYYIIQGKEDTGKSTLQKIFSLLQMNGWFGGKTSFPLMVRLLHFFSISVNQDEFEKMSREEKRNYQGVLNNGFYVDGTYNFVNTNKKALEEQIASLFNFGSKSFSVNSPNLNYDFDSSFLSRCFKTISTRKNRKTGDIWQLSPEERDKFQELTDELFVYCLDNSEAILSDIEAIKQELETEGDFGRKTDVNSLILGIIKHFKGDFYLEIKKYLKQKEGVENQDNLATKEAMTFTYLANLFKEKNQTVEITNKEVCNFLNSELDLPEGKKIHSRTIGAILRNYGLIKREDQIKREGKGYTYILSYSDFVDMLLRFNYREILGLIDDQDPSSFSSFSSFSSQSCEGNEHNEHNEHRVHQIKEEVVSDE